MTWQKAPDIIPLAHRMILAGTSDSIIILDAEDRILELNPAASNLIGHTASQAVGRSVGEVWAGWPARMEHACDEIEINQVLVLDGGEGQYTYDMRCTPIIDPRGQFIGRVVVIHDISQPNQGAELLRRTQKDLRRRNWQLAQILETGNSLRLSLNLDTLSQKIVQGVHRSLDFGAVALNLIDQDSGQMRVQAHAGLSDEGRQLMEDAVYDWGTVAGLLQEKYRVGNCFFIPHGELDWDRDFQGPFYRVISGEPTSNNSTSWHPDDALLVPIEPRQGHILGLISVDQPLDGQRPDRQMLQALEIFANIAAVAIENVQLHAQIRKERAQRASAEKSLQDLKLGMENRVVERTAELTKTNAKLVNEVNEHKQAEAELLRRNRELLSLQAAAVATTSSLDLYFVLETVTWEMANLFGVESCVISEWDQEADTLSVIARYDSGDWPDRESAVEVYHLADYPSKKHVLVERSTWQMATSSPDTDPAEIALLQATGINVQLMLPMIYQDRVVGLVEIKDSRGERTFTDHEISLAQLLANQTASAIENAGLYDKAQQEITERMRAEEQIKASLKEKEVMLKEIHHRVKNNLQVISSLLSLQSKGVEDQSALELFRESRDRIRSMALIHEKLYRSEDLARIDFAEYIRSLASYLVRSYRRNSGPVALKVNANDVAMGIDKAVPCGLIINELVSNSLKHAFPADGTSPSSIGPVLDNSNGRDSQIYVELHSNHDDQLTLIVGDNGVGFPEDLDFRETQSLGMQLVNTLTSQLDGTVELYRNDGTQFKIVFPTS